MTIISRSISDLIKEALQDSPVLLINGARQTGKSTLAQEIKPDRRYITLDDPVAFSAAHSDLAPSPKRSQERAQDGVWRSLVARPLWERKAAGSNPATPTHYHGAIYGCPAAL